MAKWAAPTWREDQPPYLTETLLEALDDGQADSQAVRKKIQPILASRLELTVSTLELSKTASTLADRLLEAGFVEEYGRRHKRK